MSSSVTYSRNELAVAVASSHSWRGVLRSLGRNCTSAGSYRAVRRQVEALGIDHSHFTAQRRWSDDQLRAAVAEAARWADVPELLGLSDSGSNLTAVRGHALRLSLEVAHLAGPSHPPETQFNAAPNPDMLRFAASSLAAAWFQLRGYEVLWPQEGCRYDLVVVGDEGFARVQVKTTTHRQGNSRMAMISSTRQDTRAAYDIDEIDHFFIVDGDVNAYLIPFAAVAGLRTISLEKYNVYCVAEGGQWMVTPVSARASP